MSATIMMATIAISGADSALAGLLVALYLSTYRKLKAPASLGFASVSGLFLAQNLWACVGYTAMLATVPESLAPILLALGLFELGALGVLMWLASR